MVLSGREKATIFLSILGAETSSRILRYLPEELADLIAAGINHLPTPSPEALSEVLGEFKSNLALPGAGETTLPTTPHAPLRTRPVPRSRKSYAFLIYERPQMIAHLLSLLPEEQREDVMAGLPKEKMVVEELLSSLKTNPITEKIGARLKEHFAERLF